MSPGGGAGWARLALPEDRHPTLGREPVHPGLDVSLDLVVGLLDVRFVVHPVPIIGELYRVENLGADLCRQRQVYW